MAAIDDGITVCVVVDVVVGVVGVIVAPGLQADADIIDIKTPARAADLARRTWRERMIDCK